MYNELGFKKTADLFDGLGTTAVVGGAGYLGHQYAKKNNLYGPLMDMVNEAQGARKASRIAKGVGKAGAVAAMVAAGLALSRPGTRKAVGGVIGQAARGVAHGVADVAGHAGRSFSPETAEIVDKIVDATKTVAGQKEKVMSTLGRMKENTNRLALGLIGKELL